MAPPPPFWPCCTLTSVVERPWVGLHVSPACVIALLLLPVTLLLHMVALLLCSALVPSRSALIRSALPCAPLHCAPLLSPCRNLGRHCKCVVPAHIPCSQCILPLVSVLSDQEDETADSFVHRVFGLQFRQYAACGECGSTSSALLYSTFVYYIPAAAIGDCDGDPSFGSLLRQVLAALLTLVVKHAVTCLW